MQCSECNGRMVKYQGIDDKEASGPLVCINGCTENEETTKPGLSGCIRFPDDWDCSWVAVESAIRRRANMPEMFDYQVVTTGSVMLFYCGRHADDQWRWLDEWPIPTQSAPALPSLARQAKRASSQLQRRQGYSGLNLPYPTSTLPPVDLDLDDDSSWKYNILPQESDLPPSSGRTKKLSSGSHLLDELREWQHNKYHR